MHGIVEERRLIVTGRPVASVELESDFWDCLEHMAERLGAKVAGLASQMDREAGSEAPGASRVIILSAWPNDR
ncbi:ribbon-helix-helix domain-containing protein [Tardiphaga sp.]|uniref:ribbon-helix-helix domain-containing protein n=1 Tax=Tardiphaga sp. TaxID=1926292 RepID=UPI0037DA72F8